MRDGQIKIGGTVIGLALLGLVVAQGMMGPAPFGGYGPGMTGQGMMGGMGMMEVYPPSAQPLAEDEARRRLETFAARFGPQARAADIMAFSNHLYAQIVTAEGEGLAEVLVDRYTGVVHPEPGPNLMWNTRFVMMGGAMGEGMRGGPGIRRRAPNFAPDLPVRYNEAAAQELAATFLHGYLPEAQVFEAQAFPGYYTFDFRRGEVEGMLSVRALTGEVWVHSWHGPLLGGHE